jgi:4-hydroxy-tetrahydrodipicolinate synthase
MSIAGLYPPLITPYDSRGAVDLDALERLAGELIDGGAAGLVALGSTGEPVALSADESAAVVEVVAGVCAGRGAQLIVGAGAADTQVTIARHEALAHVPGVTASLAVVPYYVRPAEHAVVAHFEAVAAASPVPVLAYEVPLRTGVRLSAEALLAIAAIDGVVGMKLAPGAVDEAAVRVLADAPEGFAVLCGDDAFIHPFMALGAAGAIAASAHFATERFARLVRGGDGSLAEAEALLPLALALFAEPNPVVIKGLLHAQGRIATADVRMPHLNASRAAVARAVEALRGVASGVAGVA